MKQMKTTVWVATVMSLFGSFKERIYSMPTRQSMSRQRMKIRLVQIFLGIGLTGVCWAESSIWGVTTSKSECSSGKIDLDTFLGSTNWRTRCVFTSAGIEEATAAYEYIVKRTKEIAPNYPVVVDLYDVDPDAIRYYGTGSKYFVGITMRRSDYDGYCEALVWKELKELQSNPQDSVQGNGPDLMRGLRSRCEVPKSFRWPLSDVRDDSVSSTIHIDGISYQRLNDQDAFLAACRQGDAASYEFHTRDYMSVLFMLEAADKDEQSRCFIHPYDWRCVRCGQRAPDEFVEAYAYAFGGGTKKENCPRCGHDLFCVYAKPELPNRAKSQNASLGTEKKGDAMNHTNRIDWTKKVQSLVEEKARAVFPADKCVVNMIGVDPASGKIDGNAEEIVGDLERGGNFNAINFRVLVIFNPHDVTQLFVKHVEVQSGVVGEFFWPPRENWASTPVFYWDGEVLDRSTNP